ncbi:MAG: flagellar hook-basal body complex protein, partial [Actinobacteria bacterium]|nr:flagellar hook-basal body complex protein [Actinomycetota bacterium]
IANGQTVGYKSAEYVFADQFFKAQNPQSRDRAGMGTSRMIIRRANTYGTISGTQNPLDLAIAGPGMFILAKQVDGTTPTENPQKFQYTRNGQFAVDAQNRIVNENGLFLVGYGADSQGNVITNTKSTLRLDTDPLPQVPTQESTISINVDNRKPSLAGRAFDRLDPASYSQSVAQTVYDAEGQSHILSVYYKKVNSADLVLTDSGNTGTTLTFGVTQSLGTTMNGEQTNQIATTAVPSSVTGSTQTLENVSLTHVSGGLEEVGGIKTVTGLISGNNEKATVTFGALTSSSGQVITVAGATLTTTASMTAAEVAAAFASGSTTKGTFSSAPSGWKVVSTSGATTTFVSTASSSNVSDLTIVHNLDIRYPMVQVYATGSEDQIMAGTIKSIDENTIQIKFAGLTSGHVVIGSGGSLINGTINGDRVFGTVLSSSHAVRADIADAVTGFDSASLSALSASLANANNYVRNDQTSSMSVFSAVSSSYALTASYV